MSVPRPVRAFGVVALCAASFACSKAEVRPALVVTPDPLAYGEVIWPESKDVTVTIHNRSNRPVLLKDPSFDCSCFTISKPPEAVRLDPGRSVTVGVTLRSQLTKPGALRKTMTVASDDPVEPNLSVPVTGFVADLKDVKPRQVAFGEIDAGAGAVEKKVEVRSGVEGWTPRVTEAKASNQRLLVSTKDVEGGTDVLIRTEAKAVGSLVGQVYLSGVARHRDGETRTFNDSVWVAGDVK